MTDTLNPSAAQRAQIFALLRENTPDDAAPMRPKYLDDSIADIMISRAMSSFQAPAPVLDEITEQASNERRRSPMRLTAPSAERLAS